MLSPSFPRRPSYDTRSHSPAVRQPPLPSLPRKNSGISLANMNWQEPFDLSSFYPSAPSFHMSPEAYHFHTSASPDPIDRVPSLERDLCSNFNCCGLHLSDLHSLVEHFEQAHVVVIDNTGHPVFPRNGAPDHFDNFSSVPTETQPYSTAQPYTSLVLSYPQPDSPAFEQAFVPQPQSPLLSETASTLEVESPTPAPLYPQHTILNQDFVEERDILSESDLFSYESEPNLYSPTSEQSAGLPPSSFVTDSRYRQKGTSSLVHRHRGGKSKLVNSTPRSFPRRREKAFKCPTPGCSKSYLNPNGLKYHIEKGTCKIELPLSSQSP